MAGKTNSTAKVNSKVSKVGKRADTIKSDQSADVCNAYISLRNALDGLQINSIRYYADSADEGEKVRRATELDGILRAAYKQVMALSLKEGGDPGSGGNCPPSYFDCNGFCVPYPCP